MRIPGYFLSILAQAATCAGPAAAENAADLSPALLQRCKKATALVDVGRNGSGTGFLIHASGLFVTKAHVVQDIRVRFPTSLGAHLAERAQKEASVTVAQEDVFAAVAAAHHVIHGSLRLDPNRSRHADSLTSLRPECQ